MAEHVTDVAIVGAGAIGACVALELARTGTRVAVLERGDGWAAGCSRANAGIVCPSHAGPFATLGDAARALRWIARRDSPFGLSLSWALLPWLARLLRACGDARGVRRRTDALAELARDSLSVHARYVAEGLDTGLVRSGLLDVYRTRSAFAAARRADADRSTVLSAADARAAEPLLAGRIAGAVLHPHDAHLDPLRFTTAVGRAAVAAGAVLSPGTRVLAVAARGGGVRLATSRGHVDASVAVLATGASAAQLAPALPVVAGTGCSVELLGAPLPRRPLILQEARTAITPLGDRLRLAGTMLLGTGEHSAMPDRRRLQAIVDAAAAAMPATAHAPRASEWAGARPCTPDGLPAVGWVDRERRALAATGHAMLGVTLAPITGVLVKRLLEGERDPRLAALDPARFGA